MIFCNKCGNPLDAAGTCGECVTGAPEPNAPQPRFPDAGSTSAADRMRMLTTLPYEGMGQTSAKTTPVDGIVPPSAAVRKRSLPPGLIVLFAGIGILTAAVLVYVSAGLSRRSGSSGPSTISTNAFNAPDPSSTSSRAGPSEDDLAAGLNSAIESERLVNLGGNDAYTYFTQLLAANPQHPALSNAKPRVLPKLRDLGEEIINKRMYHTGLVSLQDWLTMVRVYEWAHSLEPGDRALEARQKYMQGKLAEAQGRRAAAWQGFSAAAELDESWAVPQNDLGLWFADAKGTDKQKWRNAIPYYLRANNLKPDWDIPYNNLGTAHYYLEDYETAKSYYHQAIQQNSNWARPHKWLGDVHAAQNNFSAAIQEYQTALDLYNPNTDSLDTNSIRAKMNQLRARGY